MAQTPQFKSDAFEAIHSAVSGMVSTGTISKQTMRRFDDLCLTNVEPMSAGQIKQLRLANNVSQPVFAALLNTSAATIKKWETGGAPSGPALKLLNMVRKHGLDVLR